jgi:uncharacterized YigZ family protein
VSDTLAAHAAFTLEVKHSRFLVHAAPVETAEAALGFLAAVSDPGANHNCWAWRLDANYRSSDDGEPAGTAGRPILAAIDGQGYNRVVVVVTRWFGGIKLGAGGLVRAYGGAAAECLRRAQRLPLVAMQALELRAGFDDIGAVHAALAAFDADKLEEHFSADGVELRVSLPAHHAAALQAQLRDATRDRVKVKASCTDE